MLRKHLGKLVLTFGVFVWVFFSLLPLKTVPFPEYLKNKADTNIEAFGGVIERTQSLEHKGEASSFYQALLEIAKKEQLDLSSFFSKLKLTEIASIQERNRVLLEYLYKKSQSKLRLGLDLQGGTAFTLKVQGEALAEKSEFERQQQLAKAVDIITERVNGLGVAETLVRSEGDSRIEVQIPGLTTRDNPNALNSLQKPAKLTFHQVHRLRAPDDGKAPPVGYVAMERTQSNPRTGKEQTFRYYVRKLPEMTGDALKKASVMLNDYGAYEVHLDFTADGARRFAHITQKIDQENKAASYVDLPEGHFGKYGLLAIVLDGELYSAPRIMEPITGGKAQIQGQFSQREAFELANVLNNPLAVPLMLEEMYEVGPSLAEDARDASLKAALLGAVLVAVFMVVYYLWAGFLACLTVALNLIIILGGLAGLEASITLPGIAPLVLTIGMAVDANILIFERMREELKLGKSMYEALKAGFQKAFSTIVDANLTTLLTAVILIWLGTGPVKGFGITLTLGIFATLFTTLIIYRVLLEICVERKWIKTLSWVNWKQKRYWDFMRAPKLPFVISWILVLAGAISFYNQRDHIWGIDFVGGDAALLSFEEKIPTEALLAVAHGSSLGEVVPVYQTQPGQEGKVLLKLQTELGRSSEVVTKLQEAFPQARFSVVGESSIGAAVSDTIKKDALLALLCALVGILVYIAFRFEFGFGVGAIVSTIHDVLLSVGIYVLLGGQFSLPMLAAVLMIVGYSINDTIVVFDRIREELLFNATANLRQIINIAINKTLSRTLLTSLTTLMAALALYIFGVGVIHDFALMFILGIITGTFSSIFIASPCFYWWHKGDRKRVEAKKMTQTYGWEEGA